LRRGAAPDLMKSTCRLPRRDGMSSKVKRGRVLKTALVGLVGAVAAIAILTPKPGQGAYRGE
jgi:hypothetical protein